jgi:Asp-tRNA(Asn)/Glu-tRNA(Gln) amidotransferase A subunit family amidase
MNHLESSSELRMRRALTTAAVARALRVGMSLIAFLLATVVAVPLVRADRVDGKLEAAVHLKVLGYDRGLKKRENPSKVMIGVLYKDGGDSEKVEKEMVAAFRDMAKQLKVQGLPVEVVAIPYKADSLAADLASAGVNIIYVSTGLESEQARIQAAAAARHAPTICSDREMVRQGVAIGVFLKDKKAAIAVNIKAARALGMDLDSALFSVAEVFK